MSEQMKESLSALMDGEANELEFQRVLSLSDDNEVRQTWQRYHVARTAMREGGVDSNLASIDISQAVKATLDTESTYKKPSVFSQYLKPVASFAVAASVAGAVVVGGQFLQLTQEGADSAFVAEVAPDAVYTSPAVARVNAGAVNVSYGDIEAVEKNTAQPPATYNNLARKQLQRYMLHNAEHAALNNSQGMIPLARAVSLEEE